jgi:hypothetical protein
MEQATAIMRAGAILAMSSLFFALGACGDGDSQDGEASGGFGRNVAGGDHVPPFYMEPVPLTEGDYMPENFPFEQVAEKALGVQAAEAKSPLFEGSLNGYQVYLPESETDRDRRRTCQVEGFVPSDSLTLAYLPPGTSATSPQFRGVCPDGSVSFVMQSFVTKHASFDAIYVPGRHWIEAEAPAERVGEITLDGRPGLVIKPLVEEGFGRSYLGLSTGKGILYVDARDLPLEQTQKIIEGVRCDGC